MRCVYCELPAIKERTVLKNSSAWAFPTNIPIVPGHLLVCPQRCVPTFEQLTPQEMSDIFDLTKFLQKVLIKTFQAEGFNIAWNEGESARQNVPHWHLHLLPRKKGDTGITQYEPRQFLYRPGSREVTPEEELLKVRDIIKEHIAAIR